MGKINIGRVIMGGFIAAVIIGPSEAMRIPWFFNQYREVLVNQDLVDVSSGDIPYARQTRCNSAPH